MAAGKKNKYLKIGIFILITISVIGVLLLFPSVNKMNSNFFSPLHTNQSQWKVFISPKYGFNFKYPMYLKTKPSSISEFEKNGNLVLINSINSKNGLMLNVFSSKGTSLNAQKNDFNYPGSNNTETEFELNGIKAYRITTRDSNDETVLFEKGGNIYSISKGKIMSPEEFNGIISTINFN